MRQIEYCRCRFLGAWASKATKSLRAERMADCIFNGTAKRPPMGLAEVTLTLVDTELAEAARRVLGDSQPVAISVRD